MIGHFRPYVICRGVATFNPSLRQSLIVVGVSATLRSPMDLDMCWRTGYSFPFAIQLDIE